MTGFNLQTPRAANAAEVKEWAKFFPKLGSNFKILAPEQVEGGDGCYNCLGWVTGEAKDFASWDAFKEEVLAARCKNRQGISCAAMGSNDELRSC